MGGYVIGIILGIIGGLLILFYWHWGRVQRRMADTPTEARASIEPPKADPFQKLEETAKGANIKKIAIPGGGGQGGGEPRHAPVPPQTIPPVETIELRIKNRTPLASSFLRSVGYDEMGQLLELEFVSGEVYHYRQVHKTVYQDLLNASSHGRFYQIYIKGKFPSTKIGQLPSAHRTPSSAVPQRFSETPVSESGISDIKFPVIILHKYREVLEDIPLRVRRLQVPLLKHLLRAAGIRIPAGTKKTALAQLVLASVSEARLRELLPAEEEELYGLELLHQNFGGWIDTEQTETCIWAVINYYKTMPGMYPYPNFCMIRDHDSPDFAYGCTCIAALKYKLFCRHLWAIYQDSPYGPPRPRELDENPAAPTEPPSPS